MGVATLGPLWAGFGPEFAAPAPRVLSLSLSHYLGRIAASPRGKRAWRRHARRVRAPDWKRRTSRGSCFIGKN